MSMVRTAGSLAAMSVLLVPGLAGQAQPPQRIKVGSNVHQARLESKVEPVYPPEAKQARIQGVVRLQATISKDGAVGNLMVLGGHPLLIPAAIDAVKQWRYKPTLLRGEPVEVITQIDVNFSLDEQGTHGGAIGVTGRGGGGPIGGIVRGPFLFDVDENEKRIRVSAAAQKRKLIHGLEPEYPAKTAEARIRDVVRLEILIGTNGEVQEIRVASGHPLLIPAALEAVRKCRCRPSMLDGESVEVVTAVEIAMPPGEPIPEPQASTPPH